MALTTGDRCMASVGEAKQGRSGACRSGSRYSSTALSTMNDPIVQVLVAVLPSLVVFLTAFYLIKQFMGARTSERMLELKKDDHKHVLPLRLQAYERITLLLARIQPRPCALPCRMSREPLP